MTAYFDEACARVAESAARNHGDAGFLEMVRILEGGVVRDALLCSGDREFPDDLRETLVKCIAINGIYCPGDLSPVDRTRKTVLALQKSILIDAIHAIFHKLAERRHSTRFGWWTDDPAENLRARTECDNRRYSELRE